VTLALVLIDVGMILGGPLFAALSLRRWGGAERNGLPLLSATTTVIAIAVITSVSAPLLVGHVTGGNDSPHVAVVGIVAVGAAEALAIISWLAIGRVLRWLIIGAILLWLGELAAAFGALGPDSDDFGTLD
jgi:hypothetical protein